MFQLRADNEKMQKTISRNGYKETADPTDDKDDAANRKKLNIGDLSTFDTIALETEKKDGHKFVLYVHLDTSAADTSKSSQDDTKSGRVAFGSVELTGQTQWSALDDIVYGHFTDYISRLDPSSGVGLTSDSILCYHVGEVQRTKGAKQPELLPCGYLVGENRDVVVKLRGSRENCVDQLSFTTLVPKNIVERYVSLLVEHRRLIFCGPSGTGKSFLARRLAEHLVQISDHTVHPGSIATFTVDRKSSRELRQYMSNVAELYSDDVTSGSVAPTVIVVENLHHVTSLGEAFSCFFTDSQPRRQRGPYIIGTMRQTTSSTSADLQLTHHNFRWVLFTNHSEPVRGLLARYLQRQLVTETVRRGSEVDCDGQMTRIISWLPKTWNHLNRFLQTNCSADVTIGPRLFLSCPMDSVGSRVWFTDLWNYSIVPYLLEALRDAKQTSSRRATQWQDPVDWVLSQFPWSPGSGGDWPSLHRLCPDDVAADRPADVNRSNTDRLTSCLQNGGNAADPLMNMLLRLQEATMCSSLYSGDGLELGPAVSCNESLTTRDYTI